MRINAMAAVVALCLSTMVPVLIAPAAHGDDVLTTIDPASAGAACPLRRVEEQLVRCDDLTGAGVDAAPWIPQLQEPLR